MQPSEVSITGPGPTRHRRGLAEREQRTKCQRYQKHYGNQEPELPLFKLG